jgi:TPR repeat protein
MRRVALLALLLSSLAHAADDPALLYSRAMDVINGGNANRSPLQAVSDVRVAAQQGYVPAQYATAYFYEIGFQIARDPQAAFTWYTRAANQGDRLSQWALGRMYLTGLGTLRNLNEAAGWLEKSANQGDPFAAQLLAVLKEQQYAWAEASNWYHRAAEGGLPQAQAALGRLYRTDRLGMRDYAQAFFWLRMASLNGLESARNAAGEVERQLTPEQADQVNDRVRAEQDRYLRGVNDRGCSGWDGEFDHLPKPPPPDLQRYCRR